MTDSPCSESSATLRWMSALAPTSMPRVGSSRMMSSGAVASQRASSTFCWLPPERLRGEQVRVGGPHVEGLHVLGDDGVLLGCGGSCRSQPRRAWMPSTMFSATVRSPMMPSARRSSDENDDALVDRVRAARSSATALPLTSIVPGVGAVGAVEQPDELGAPGAEQAGDADDLALVDVEVGGLEHAAASDAGRAQHGRARAVDGRARPCDEMAASSSSSRPIILVTSVSAGEVAGEVLADELAVAQHRDAVGDLVDLVEEVADEEDRRRRCRGGRA